ncbi:MAG: hypothetical protein AAF196_04710 [Planctomycetota bacterium]
MSRPQKSSRPGAVVLKIGGSVLDDRSSLRLAVQEVERELRAGRRVAVVVSAFLGRTNELQESLPRAVTPTDAAETLATGEFEAVRALTRALQASGLRARDLHPTQLGLIARGGSVLDSESARIDLERAGQVLDSSRVLVIPGYVASGANGWTRLLGRGGSDWSAFLLADAYRRLGHDVRCRLIKDVDGLYEADPHDGRLDFAPRRFGRVRFEDLPHLDTDPSKSIVQPKALAFARARGLEIEIATWNQSDPTVVGTEDTVFRAATTRPPLRVAVLGCGAVGRELVRQCVETDFGIEPVVVAVRDSTKSRPDVPHELLTTDLDQLFAAQPDVLVEVAGGLTDARIAVESALGRGLDVVTANKALIAEHGGSLTELSGRLRCGAAVGGGVPMLETVRRLRGHGIRRLRGVLNGTSNFVLDRIGRGLDPAKALAEARAEGLCEANPSLDLDGTDAAQKLRILVREATGENAETRQIEALDPQSASARSNGKGRAIRQVAEWQGRELRVRLESVPESDPLYRLPSTQNRLLIELQDGTVTTVDGEGAGPEPTVRALVQDLCELRREARQHSSGARTELAR